MIFESNNREMLFTILKFFIYKDIAKIILDYDDEFDHILNAITYKKWSEKYRVKMNNLKNTDILFCYCKYNDKVMYILTFEERRVETTYNTHTKSMNHLTFQYAFNEIHFCYYCRYKKSINNNEHMGANNFPKVLIDFLQNYLKFTHNSHIKIDNVKVDRFMNKIIKDLQDKFNMNVYLSHLLC